MKTKNCFIFLLIASGAAAVCGEVTVARAGEEETWSNHFQATVISQTHGSFGSPTSGPLSTKSAFEDPTSFTATLFVGRRLWNGGAFFINPEESAGAGLSQTHGIAEFPNGEVYRVDDITAKTNLSRLFVRQDFGVGGGQEQFEDSPNQFAGLVDVNRFSVVAGKFSLNDYFDSNTYSHDPRSQFLNWALMDNPAWDYAADTRGYTWGVYLEAHAALWTLRIATVEEPVSANALDMDGDIIHAHGDNAELEYRYHAFEHPGRSRVLLYANHANMGNYRQAIQQAAAAGAAPDITSTRAYRTKYGFGLNAEQEITSDLGLFSRLGYNDGATETWAFTEADVAFSVGASLKGSTWSRPDDVVGLALMAAGLSKDHADYLSAGGLGFIVGDGSLSYAPEEILEAYYQLRILKPLSLTGDFQYVANPGYNSARGPVPIFAARLHAEF